LPIGGFTFVGVLLFLRLESPPRKKLSILEQLQSLDPLGLLFFAPSMVCLILALQWGGTTSAWSSPKIIALLTTFALLFTVFLIIETLTPETAMAPPRIILNRSIAGSMIFFAALSGALMALIYYLSLYFQATQSLSATQAGLHMLPLLLSFVTVGIISAMAVQKSGYYVPCAFVSAVFCALGAGLLSTLHPQARSAQWMGYQVLFGVGTGAGFQVASLVAQTVLARDDVAIGVALVFFVQQLGGAVFLAVAQNVFAARLVRALSAIAGLDATVVVDSGATGIRAVVAPEQVVGVVAAYGFALTRVFVMAAALSACMVFGAAALEWRSIKGKEKEGEAVAGGGGAEEEQEDKSGRGE